MNPNSKSINEARLPHLMTMLFEKYGALSSEETITADGGVEIDLKEKDIDYFGKSIRLMKAEVSGKGFVMVELDTEKKTAKVVDTSLKDNTIKKQVLDTLKARIKNLYKMELSEEKIAA